MFDIKGNPKEELRLLKLSVFNNIESIDKIYSYYMDNRVKENIDTLVSIVYEPWEITKFNKSEIRETFEKSFSEKESLLNSLFFYSISIIESTLCKTAYLVNKKNTEKIDKKINGSAKFIEKLKVFIERELGFNMNIVEWSNILEYYDIRNRFIHNAGTVDKVKATIYGTKYGIDYNDDLEFLIINEKFLVSVCNEIKTFFDSFLNEVDSRM